MSTFVEVLRGRALTQPDRPAYHFLDDDTSDGTLCTVSYRQLDTAARTIAATLTQRGATGQPVLLLYPPGYAYVAGFLGCLYAGAPAVPAYPPDPTRWQRTLPRLRALVADCGATTALSTSELVEMASGLAGDAPELATLDWLATDTLPSESASAWSPPALDGGSLAVLQYTSGSTGEPRGVMLSHANLLHNADLVRAGFGTSPEAVGVSWLPPYHDMGLLGGILQPLFAGFPLALLSPLAFLRRPLTWLETISRFGATMSGGPNFAYDLCVRKSTPEQRAQLDLSGWRVAFCGAEPVRTDTMHRFAEAFAPAGFTAEAFYPCYGLAEATLIVTGTQPPRTIATGHVSCGPPLGDQRLRVVDPDTGTDRPPGTEGEIWLSGPSVAHGYWRRPELTAHTFGAIAADDPDRRYLRTGDLGILDGAELVVTGRVKDLIIVRGRNIHPHDLEEAVERHVPGVRPGGTAAFPVPRDDGEQVGVACELAGSVDGDDTGGSGGSGVDGSGTIAAIRQMVAQTAEVPVATVVLLRRGRLPKTSSGKVQRHQARHATLAGTWHGGAPDVVMRWDDGDADTAHAAGPDASGPKQPSPVVSQVGRVLGVSPGQLSTDRSLTSLGLDSLRAIELQGVLQTWLGLRVDLSDLLSGASVDDLIARMPTAPPPSAATSTGDGPATAMTSDECVLSEGQQALWLIDRWAPGNTAYRISRAARIRSPLDVDALELALEQVAARHQALRVTLSTRDGVPVWRPRTGTGPLLERHDVTGTDENVLQQRVQADADRPFDVERGPLWRVALYSRDHDDHVLLLSMHHLITDFWSLSVMVEELLSCYHRRADLPAAAHAAHGPAPPRDEPTELQRRLRFWREELAGAPAVLELPARGPRPRVQSLRGDTHRFHIDAATLRRLDRVAATTGVTRFAVLAAALATVLSRYTGEDDLVLGTAAAGRGGTDHHRLGYFANPVPLRIRPDHAASFRNLVTQVGRTVITALDHAVSFPRLVEALQPTRDPGRPPVVQAMLVLQRPPAERADLGGFAVGDERARLSVDGLEARPYPLADRGAAYDLALTMAEVAGGLTGLWHYCADLFDAATVQRLTGHLQRVLEQATRDPDAPLAALELTTAAERQWALAAATGPTAPYPDQHTLHGLFATYAAGRPDDPAVVAGDQGLTYRELDGRADALAATLVDTYGVDRGDPVGVHLPRGVDAVVAFWAALKTGGAYLPLPADLPSQRLAWLVADARPAVVVTCHALAGQLPADGPPAMCLDQPPPPAPAPAVATGPDDLAYIVYTSGSTGQPKAVLLPHRGACNLAQVFGHGLQVGPGARFLQFSSSAYDVHVSDIITAHLYGAALYLPPVEATLPGPALADLLASQRITHAVLSPSVLGALPDADLPDLSHLVSGGESLPATTAARWARDRRFFNGYGPAETTVCVMWWEYDPAEPGDPPLGRPFANLSVHVLDPWLRPVPAGVPGEICIGGVCVGRGYFNRPDLTAQRFVPDPFGPLGARLYRTGDRARRREDGAVEFLGRFDEQVKIRGIRIEPGEIEARLREVSGVREAVVVPRPATTGDKELVAYLVNGAAGSGGTPPPAAELRQHLRAHLPEPWLPAAFVHLDALPLNRSGKVDRHSLPAPRDADRGRRKNQAPRTALERTVAEVWSEVLGHPEVGVADHFFDHLGGTSLHVATVTDTLGRRLNRQLPVTLLFEHPTVELLARRLTGGRDEEPDGPAPEDQAARRRRALARRTGRLQPEDPS